MNWLFKVASLAISLLLVPAGAGAYSFLPAFDPGEQILSIELVSAGVSGFPVEVDTDPAHLLAVLRHVKDDAYRIKGFVPVGGGSIYVDVAAGQLSTRMLSSSRDTGELVFIFRPQVKELIDEIADQLGEGRRRGAEVERRD